MEKTKTIILYNLRSYLLIEEEQIQVKMGKEISLSIKEMLNKESLVMDLLGIKHHQIYKIKIINNNPIE